MLKFCVDRKRQEPDTTRHATPPTDRRGDSLHIVLDFYRRDPVLGSGVLGQGQSQGQGQGHGHVQNQGKSQGHSQGQEVTTLPYWEGVSAAQNDELFLEGMLLKSLESKAVHRFIQYLVYRVPRSGQDTQEEVEPVQHMDQSRCIDTGGHGCYSEMYTCIGHDAPPLPKRPKDSSTAYIITAFKAIGHVKELDKSWSCWSGADLIVDTIPPLLKLQRVTFHKVKDGITYGGYAYVLLCELGEGMTHKNRALGFVDTLKVRQCGLSSLYSVVHCF